MTTEEINKLTWFDLINKLKKFFKSIKDSLTSLTNRIIDLENTPPPSQDFIPLSGTTEGNPVTGSIEIIDAFELYTNGGQNAFAIDGEQTYMYADDGQSVFSVLPLEAKYNSITEGAKGFTSDQDFSKIDLTNKLIYAQRNYVDKGHSYSTDEILTGGTWIDGKPIYRKVLIFESTLSPADSNNIDLTLLGIETILPIQGYFKQDLIIMNLNTATFDLLDGSIINNVQSEISLDGGYSLSITNYGIYNVESHTVILEYTKTTD